MFNVILIKDKAILENSTLEIVCVMTKHNFYSECFWAISHVSMEWLSNILKIATAPSSGIGQSQSLMMEAEMSKKH
jgi:hypothetical protein